LGLIFAFHGLSLQSFPYFIYLLHTDVSALIVIDNLGEIWLSPARTAQNGPTRTMAPLLTAVTAPNELLLNASSLAHIHIDLTSDVGQPLTAHQRAVTTHMMAKVWDISSPRELQVEAVVRLVFETNPCLFLIRKTGEGKSAVVLTSSTLL
jgi:hypothetical protein